MAKLTPENREALSVMKTKLTSLQKELAAANRREGIDPYVSVKVKRTDARFTRTKIKDAPDKAIGKYQLFVDIASKQVPVYVPLTIASSKKVTGFMYHIEGTGESSVESATVEVRGVGTTLLTLGTLEYAHIPAGGTATFRLDITIRGKIGKKYHIVINRLNYKLALADARYQQYLKPITSDSLKFS